MIVWNGVFARTARRLSRRFDSMRLRRSLARSIQRTRAESQDRAFLATKPGGLYERPTGSSGR